MIFFSGLNRLVLGATLAILLLTSSICRAQNARRDPPPMHPVAIFPFTSRTAGQEELCSQAAELLFAELSAQDDILLVERADLAKLLDEQELSLGGLVNPATANIAGQLTGAKILVTGSVFEVGETTYLVAKVIGTETSRVLGASVKGDADGPIDTLVEELADDIAKLLRTRSGDLVAQRLDPQERVKMLTKKLGKGKRPTLWIEISERHIGQVTIDPAAETELIRLCRETGFQVIDAKSGSRRQADILLLGEAFSEMAVRRNHLVSVKGRVELKAIDRDGDTVIDADRQTSLAVDVAEHSASKTALENAAADLALRLLPKLVKHQRQE